MNKEILTMVEAISNEKGLSKQIIFEALEVALASATKKLMREDSEVRVAIDTDTGNYDTFRRWEVIENDAEDIIESKQMTQVDAQDKQSDIAIGDFIEEPMKSVGFGRIAAQNAKQVIMQKVREAERDKIYNKYSDEIGTMLSGIVKRVDRNGVYLDVDNNAEAFIPRDQMIPKESVRTGDRLRAYLKDVKNEGHGAQLHMSRTSPNLLIELFKVEVPEINEGLIDILGGARDPGLRAKIAVKANEPRIDPVGTCIGMRGSRVQTVSNELNGERVDIIVWDENPAQFIVNAMSPAEIASVMIDEDENSVDIIVTEENLSQAIGRGGQNVRLASELTKWKINIMSVEESDKRNDEETDVVQKIFMQALDVDEEIANILSQEGFSTIEEIAYVPEKEMLGIEEFDEKLVKTLRDRARDIIITKKIAEEEKIEGIKPSDDLLSMKGIDEALAYSLIVKGITNVNDLAEQSVDELKEKVPDITDERAAELILTARQPWFEQEENQP